MKIIRGLLLSVIAIFRAIYKWIDKHIIVPITKFILFLGEKTGSGTGRFEKWVTKRSTLIFISLLLALAAFFYVDNESNILIDSSAEVLYDQQVEVTYNAEAYVIEGLPESVDVTLIGRKVDLYLAKQLSTGKVGADLSNLKEGTHKITLSYQSPIRSVSYKLDPSTVNVNIYQKVSKKIELSKDVINKDKLDNKLSIASVNLDQNEVIIKGAEHTLDKVATVKALVDVGKIVNPEVGVTELDDVKLVAYDDEGNTIDVEIVPEKVKASISIESPSKEIPIKVVPQGNVEFGKSIDSISSNITKVVVYGDRDVLDSLEYIPINVDVSGLSKDKDFSGISIPKPNGVSNTSDATVTVSVKLGTEISMELGDISIDATNLDENYKVVAIGENSSKTTVIVKGTENVLKAVDASNVKATIDLSDYSEGDYEVPVIVTGDDVRATYESKTTKVKIRISKK